MTGQPEVRYAPLFEPFRLKHLKLRNRVMSTSHSPAYAEDGLPRARYQLYHEEKAKGGLALTMFGGSSVVDLDSPPAFGQLDVSDDRVIPHFQDFAARIHRHGAALMCQITHMGFRTHWSYDHWLPVIGPSAAREPAHRAVAKAMEPEDIRRVVAAFGAAARRCKEGGLDGVELLATGHLIDQFWTPAVNWRSDPYGGGLENRMRFGLEALEAVRRAVGDDFIVGIRLVVDELIKGGLSQEDGMAIVDRYAATGMLDFLNVNAGQIRDHAGLAKFIPPMGSPLSPYLNYASAVKAMTGLPVFHATNIKDPDSAAQAIQGGHVDMVAMTRAHLADPHIMRKLAEGRAEDIRPCVGATYCLDRIYVGGEALCLHNPATGREAAMPHVVPRADRPGRKVVVVGAGPAGLEAARVSALRGHDVVLFEAADRTGGQVNIAARATWRGDLGDVVGWLDGQVRKLGVDVRLNVLAEAEHVLAGAPDVVVIATGGAPNPGRFARADLAVSSWDVLSGAVRPAGRVLLYDETGQHQGVSCAEVLAASGAEVEIATPDRTIAEETGATNFPVHLRALYRAGVAMSPDRRLVGIERAGNRLVATLVNVYAETEERREVDQVVVEAGTLPLDDLYFALKPLSLNRGETDLAALVAGRPQAKTANPDGRFELFRVGDAVASRNIHAAIFDSLRLCKGF